ncbi:MAG: CoA-binding protein [Bacteroidetes bacterium]|jgi:Predicted CoA-binding protein|uniref:CoA-binding protein n=1 Tax=Phnomibacter sp. TaxID=2836217 RepID=UPI002FDCDEF4|nr:CoA-binding protein [Bacteroidota bacterium]
MSESKKTVIIGASDNSNRYSYIAANRLVAHGHEVVPIGIKKGRVAGLDIITDHPALEQVDTITMYINPQRQLAYYDYILSLHPKRVIFNPGTENDELEEMLQQQGIQTMEACTLVMLSTGQF